MTKNKISPRSIKDDLMELINARIENLRPKLLDLTRRNPLLSTKFSDRSHSHIRIVDELPQILFQRLMEGKMMKFIPLPPLEADPKDEQSRKFKNVLTDARLTDEIYIKALEAIDQDAENSAEKLAIAERELKDRIRESLKMPPRQTKTSLSLVQHARNNNILPSYDLPLPNEENSDGRHQDAAIQTLLLPDMLEKRLNSIISKCNTWIDETGINVLRAAFGLLEWTESSSSEAALAPLILMPIEIEKKKTREGFEYIVCSLGETPEINTVLMEKLKREFGINLPVFNPEELNLENYFNEVGRIKVKGMTWRVRRQVAIGVFPSARMAMYHDLDTKSWEFHTHEVITGLLGGGKNSGNGSTPFGDEYEIDHPDIEIKVPMIVTDADASQFSVIVDVMDDKSVAVEGPPGSGKSQTIVNTIAVALSHGKKVLFVAEKTAALEVVRSRLEACRLGEFLLTLQATRSSKEKVIESIRERIQIPVEKEPPGLDEKIQQFKTIRTQLNDYIQIISSQFANTDFTVHDVLGYCMHAQEKLSDYAQELSQVHVAGVRSISQEAINEIVHFCNQLETAWKKAHSLKPYWGKIKKPNLDPYSAEEILQVARECTQSCAEAFAQREKIANINLNKGTATNVLIKLKAELELIVTYQNIDIDLIKRLLDDNALQEIDKFFSELEDARKSEAALSNFLVNPMHVETPKYLEQLAKALELMNLSEPSEAKAEKYIVEIKSQLEEYQQKIATLEEIIRVANFLKEKSVSLIVSFCDVATSAPKSILALRSARLELTDTKEVIARASQRASNIEQQRIKLEATCFINNALSREDLRTNASILEGAGFLCFFSPKFHKAKRFYRTISKEKAFDKLNAASTLREIIHWRENLEAFNNDVALQEFFGAYFNGCETKFSPFVELFEFYDRIDTQLSGIDNKVLRDFLKHEEIGLILALPKLSTENLLRLESRDTIVQLKKKADDLVRKIELFGELKAIIGTAPQAIKILHEMSPDKLMALARDTIALQAKKKNLNENNRIKRVLGPYFDGTSTIKQKAIEESISVLERILSWEDEFQEAIVNLIEDKKMQKAIEILSRVIGADNFADKSITKLSSIINVEKEQLIGSSDMKELSEFFALAAKDREGLIAHSIVYANKQEVMARGCGDVVEALIDSKKGLQNLADLTKAVIVQSLIKEVYKDHGSILARYDGNKLNHLRKRLAELDRQIIELSRKRLRVKLRKQAKPPEGTGEGRRSEWTEMALLNNEISKKKRLLPVRDLTKRAGKALLEIKPCWMMSPLAVAQYIEKGSIEFDLVIIDEASQMTPEDAIGALARCKQAMVVGDTNQLPPTPFFKKIIDDIDEDEDETILEESILEMANAVFRPARRLRWHYRSKHPDLIAFSNRYVYDDDLTIFPCPDIHRTDKGVSFHAVKGFYSKGTNPIEATEIVNAAIKFMHNHKDMSLGIVVLNQKQQELVDEQVQYVIAHDPIAQEYIEKWRSPKIRDGLEPFFVKNLENVQGDERDVIFIGTVYGPEKEGAPVMQRFGPINGIAGKRRLNVLFTRAKHKIVTFSSMTSSDIRVDRHSNKGVELLQAWLEYCASGKLLARELTKREPGSPFEEFIIAQLKAIGCHPECQVGVSGYFIDIGVKHPAWPHGFIMGVECDGRAYHSSKSARDRDRLREEVLAGLGWDLYRIWSTDWFNNPIYEAQQLRRRIEKRLDELKKSQNN